MISDRLLFFLLFFSALFLNIVIESKDVYAEISTGKIKGYSVEPQSFGAHRVNIFKVSYPHRDPFENRDIFRAFHLPNLQLATSDSNCHNQQNHGMAFWMPQNTNRLVQVILLGQVHLRTLLLKIVCT